MISNWPVAAAKCNGVHPYCTGGIDPLSHTCLTCILMYYMISGAVMMTIPYLHGVVQSCA